MQKRTFNNTAWLGVGVTKQSYLIRLQKLRSKQTFKVPKRVLITVGSVRGLSRLSSEGSVEQCEGSGVAEGAASGGPKGVLAILAPTFVISSYKYMHTNPT